MNLNWIVLDFSSSASSSSIFIASAAFALLQMGHLLAHQVIELPRLEHVLNGVAHLDVLLFVGFVADLLEHIVENVAYHLYL